MTQKSSFLLHVHKVQVIPDLTGMTPPKKKSISKKKKTEPILYKTRSYKIRKKSVFGQLNHNLFMSINYRLYQIWQEMIPMTQKKK